MTTAGNQFIEQDRVRLTETVKVYPSLLAGFLKQHEAPQARLYLLVRLIDKQGQGWVDFDLLVKLFTNRQSPYYIFTRKRLKQIVRKGNGRFWGFTDNKRIRYKSPDKIAFELDCKRLTGKSVAMPREALLSGIQQFRAYCQAAYVTGRGDGDKPISRFTLRCLTGLSASSQRTYGRIAHIKHKVNVAISTSEKYSQEALQEKQWKFGGHVFRFTDYKGVQDGNQPGDECLAWQRPNSYQTSLETVPKGRQRKINRAIDLVFSGRGIGQVEKIYHLNGEAAANAFNRSPQVDHYFQTGQTLSLDEGEAVVWEVVPAEKPP